MSNGADEKFLLKEYECLREEIVWLLKDYRALERNVVIAVGLSWAWLFDHEKSPKFAWFMPVVFVALGAVRASGVFKQFGVFHTYVKHMEKHFLGLNPTPSGWEHYSWNKTGWVSDSARALWVLLGLSVVLVAVLESIRGR